MRPTTITPSGRTWALLAIAGLLAACSSGMGSSPTATRVLAAAETTTAKPTPFALQPGTEQLAVLGAEPGTEIAVAHGNQSHHGTVDAQGSLLFRGLTPGSYDVRIDGATVATTTVGSRDAVPASALYTGQHLTAPGYGYLTTRDGTTLSANILLPGPADSGPYPTVVEYSGYDPSNPDGAFIAQLYTALGFAYVGVNIRGTGCSGGSYDFFEESQLLDGYDTIETVAAQPWVLNHEVGMVGISYAGLSQLFVAATQPPHLAAISPLSVSDDLYRSTLYPGGVLNTGFTVGWVGDRMKEAAPYGQAWTASRADSGDTICADNQRLRLQNPDLVAQLRATPFYDTAIGDRINTSKLAPRITVPVFIAGAWQDEQTGGHWPALVEDFTASPHVYTSLTNGLHSEALSLGVLPRYLEFLDIYVAHRTPSLAGTPQLIPALLYQYLTGVASLTFGPDRFAGQPYEQAKASFESEPPVRILFEEGDAAGTPPGSPAPRFEADVAAWPVPGTVAAPMRLTPGPGGTTYVYDPDAVPDTFYNGPVGDIWRADAKWDWRPAPKGAVVGFESSPYTADTVLAGDASADLWITSSTPDTDLEVTLTEIRPDGTEIYIQSGWLRASQRQLDDAASSPLEPVQTHVRADSAPLPVGQATLVRVDVFPFAHVVRAGSRLRVIIGSPGGNRARWAFENLPKGGSITVLTDDAHPSEVMLPVVPGITVPAGAPPCGSLRGQPCRTYVPLG